MRRDDGVPARLQVRDGGLHAGVGAHVHPAVGPGGPPLMGPQPRGRPHGVRLEHPDRVAGPQDRREVVGLVDVVQQYRQVRLAAVEDLAGPQVPVPGHGAVLPRASRSLPCRPPKAPLLITTRWSPGRAISTR